MVNPVMFWFSVSWHIFSHPFTFHLFVGFLFFFLYLKWVSFRLHIVRSFIFIQPNNLLIRVFRLFVFNVNIDIVCFEFIICYLLSICLISSFHQPFLYFFFLFNWTYFHGWFVWVLLAFYLYLIVLVLQNFQSLLWALQNKTLIYHSLPSSNSTILHTQYKNLNIL